MNNKQKALELIDDLKKIVESELIDESPIRQLARVMKDNNLSISIRKEGNIRICQQGRILATVGDYFDSDDITRSLDDEG